MNPHFAQDSQGRSQAPPGAPGTEVTCKESMPQPKSHDDVGDSGGGGGGGDDDFYRLGSIQWQLSFKS